MPVVWVRCQDESCSFEDEDFITPALPFQATPCPKCGEPLGRTYKDLHFGIATADLRTFENSYQPAFGKVINSKREAKEECRILEARTGQHFEWDPTVPKVVKDAEKIRKEPGGEAYLVNQLKEEATQKASNHFKASMEQGIQDFLASKA